MPSPRRGSRGERWAPQEPPRGAPRRHGLVPSRAPRRAYPRSRTRATSRSARPLCRSPAPRPPRSGWSRRSASRGGQRRAPRRARGHARRSDDPRSAPEVRDEAKDAPRQKREHRRRDLMPRGLRRVPLVLVGPLGGVLLEDTRARETLHGIVRLGYSRAERARELVRGLRGVRGISNVAREKPRLAPRRFDRTVAPEAPVEPRDREREQNEQEAEEDEGRTRIDGAHRGHHGVSAEPAAITAAVQLVLGTVRTVGVVRTQAGVPGGAAVARIRTGVERSVGPREWRLRPGGLELDPAVPREARPAPRVRVLLPD